jgi:hypothetical protein
MLAEAWGGLKQGEMEEKDKYYQNRQTDFHETNLLLNYYMQIQCPPPKLITH